MLKKALIILIMAVVIVVIIAMMFKSQSSLLTIVKNARYSPTCEKMVPMGGIAGYPIPLKIANGERIYQAFFFGLNPSYPGALTPGQEPQLVPPAIVAELHLDGTALCSRLITSPEIKPLADYGPRFSSEANKLSTGAFDSHKNDLYLAIERVAKFYFADDNGQNAKDSANNFFDQFTYLFEPGLKQFYYELNPDFWQWLEKLTGKKLVEEAVASTPTVGVTKGLDKVPEEARALLPRNGALIVSGGLLSSSRRVIADLDKKTLTFTVNPTPNTSVYNSSLHSDQAQLTNEQAGQITALINDTFTSTNTINQRPVPDFDIILFLARNNSVKVIDSFGPAVGPAQKLYEYVWNLAPANF